MLISHYFPIKSNAPKPNNSAHPPPREGHSFFLLKERYFGTNFFLNTFLTERIILLKKAKRAHLYLHHKGNLLPLFHPQFHPQVSEVEVEEVGNPEKFHLFK